MRAAPRRRLATILLPALALLALAAVAGLLWLPPADPAQAQAQTEQSERPTITAGPVITSSPARGDTYGQGQTIRVAVTFSEAVTVTGEPRVRLTMGDRTRWARYASSSSDGTVLTFNYTVKDNDQDGNGISIKKNQLQLRDGTIQDADGNSAKLKHPALPDQSGHKVDGTPPFITAGPVITSSPASGDAYGEGEAIVVAVTFSEAVTVSGDARVPMVVGERQRWARYSHSEQDGTVLAFTYQVKKVDADSDGVSIGANQLALRDGSIQDAGGNAASLEHPALPDQPAHKVNGSPPQPEPTPIPAPTPTPTPEPVPAQPPQPQPQVADNTPPTIQSLSFSWKAPGSHVVVHVARPRTKTVGVAQLRANITFSEAIDESQTTIKYRIGSGSERTFSFASSQGEGKCAYISGAGLYECTYTATAGESGLFQVRVTAYKDTSGNAGLPSSYHTGWGITVNTGAPKAPTLALKNPKSSPGNVARPEFTATLSETGGILWVWPNEQFICDDFYGRREGYGHLFRREDVTDATQPYVADIVTSRSAALTSDGAVTYYAIHTDEHFNPSPCGTFTYVYDSTPPAKPKNLVASRGQRHESDRFTLTWDDPKDPTVGKYQYRKKGKFNVYGVFLYDWDEWTDIPGSNAATTSHTVTGLNDVREYLFELRVEDKVGNVSEPTRANHAPVWGKYRNYAGDMNLEQYKERYTDGTSDLIWSAVLTVDADGAYYGCDNTADANTPDRCSAPSVLTDDDFRYAHRSWQRLYTIDEALWHNPSPDKHDFRLKFDSRQTGEEIQTALERLRLIVGATHRWVDAAWADVDDDSKPTLTWQDMNLGWTEGQKVRLALSTGGDALRRTGLVIARMGNVFYDPDGDPLTYRMWRQDGNLHFQDQYGVLYGDAFVIDAEGNIRTTPDTRYFLGKFRQPPRNSHFVLCVEAKDSGGAKTTRCITFDASDRYWPRGD